MDLNADLGEGLGDEDTAIDDAILQVVTSASIACGFHAGDPVRMQHTVIAAVERGVVIGAHVSYPDPAGFGRRETGAPPRQIEADVLYQLAALDGIASAAGSRVRYVKPHGALYHRIVRDGAAAAAVVRAMRTYEPGLVLLTLPDSAALPVAAAAGIRTVVEGFADRSYGPEGGLLPRDAPGAVLDDPRVVAGQATRLARPDPPARGIDSLCVHGDTPGALLLAREVRSALELAGVGLAPFCG